MPRSSLHRLEQPRRDHQEQQRRPLIATQVRVGLEHLLRAGEPLEQADVRESCARCEEFELGVHESPPTFVPSLKGIGRDESNICHTYGSPFLPPPERVTRPASISSPSRL